MPRKTVTKNSPMDFPARATSENPNWYEKTYVKTAYKSNREQYRTETHEAELAFREDARQYAINKGVPEKYSAKVVIRAWEDGHSSGFSEVYNHLETLIDIFDVAVV